MEAARDAHALLVEIGRLLGELEALLAPPAASLSAGPFTALGQVDAFGARLRALEGVIDVGHLGFEGDRALFDVRLGAPR